LTPKKLAYSPPILMLSTAHSHSSLPEARGRLF
jgi:hypothetical protein